MDVVKEAVDRLEENGGHEYDKKDALKFGNVPLLGTKTQLHGLLTVVSEELPDIQLYYTLPDLCHALGCQSPPMNVIRSALVNAGYRVSQYHKEAQAIKTDAPNRIVWDIMRAWCKNHPPKGQKSKKKVHRKRKNELNDFLKKKNHIIKEECYTNCSKHETGDDAQGMGIALELGSDAKTPKRGEKPHEPEFVSQPVVDDFKTNLCPGKRILAIEPSIKVDFTIPWHMKNRKKAQRFPINPEPNWGPKPKASGYTQSEMGEKLIS